MLAATIPIRSRSWRLSPGGPRRSWPPIPRANRYMTSISWSRRRNARYGTFGDIAVFSTMYRKSLSTGGNGGLVYCRDLDLFRLCLAHADRGKPAWRDDLDLRSPQHCLFPALNWTTNEFACAIGLSYLKRLQATVDARRSWTRELSRRLALESQACSPYAIDDIGRRHWVCRTGGRCPAVSGAPFGSKPSMTFAPARIAGQLESRTKTFLVGSAGRRNSVSRRGA